MDVRFKKWRSANNPFIPLTFKISHPCALQLLGILGAASRHLRTLPHPGSGNAAQDVAGGAVAGRERRVLRMERTAAAVAARRVVCLQRRGRGTNPFLEEKDDVG